MPAFEVFKHHKRSLMHGILCGFAPNFTFYIATVFLVSYGPKQLGIPSSTIFVALMIAASLQVFTLPFFATFADKYSQKKVLLTGCVLVAVGASRSSPSLALEPSGGVFCWRSSSRCRFFTASLTGG